jgi:hypothetical protein
VLFRLLPLWTEKQLQVFPLLVLLLPVTHHLVGVGALYDYHSPIFPAGNSVYCRFSSRRTSTMTIPIPCSFMAGPSPPKSPFHLLRQPQVRVSHLAVTHHHLGQDPLLCVHASYDRRDHERRLRGLTCLRTHPSLEESKGTILLKAKSVYSLARGMGWGGRCSGWDWGDYVDVDTGFGGSASAQAAEDETYIGGFGYHHREVWRLHSFVSPSD